MAAKTTILQKGKALFKSIPAGKTTAPAMQKEKSRTAIVREGKTALEIPSQSLKDPFHAEAFYNPFMRLNRSLSVLCLQTALPMLEGANILDGLCSLGARGVRYAAESKGVKQVTFVDANPSAIKLAKKNVARNRKNFPKGTKTKIIENDLNRALLDSRERFDFIELDPFGSPVFYLENSIRRCNKKAILSVTATDLANLHGSRPAPCVRMYDAKPLKCMFGHENGLRILIGKIARSAAMQDYSTKPLLSFYQRHFVKTFVLLERGALAADECLKQNMGFISLCPKCLHAVAAKLPKAICEKCGERTEYAGPLWLGKTSDSGFAKSVAEENQMRNLEDKAGITKMLELLKQETEGDFPPWFFDLHAVAGHFDIPLNTSGESAISQLKSRGFEACRTHFSPTGIRTNADAATVAGILK